LNRAKVFCAVIVSKMSSSTNKTERMAERNR
jgi:hypothetical protein